MNPYLPPGCTDAEIEGPQAEQSDDTDFFEREYLPGFDEI